MLGSSAQNRSTSNSRSLLHDASSVGILLCQKHFCSGRLTWNGFHGREPSSDKSFQFLLGNWSFNEFVCSRLQPCSDCLLGFLAAEH